MFKNSALAILLLVFFLLVPISMAATVLSDDFNDNLKGDMWELFYLDGNNLWLEETSQHLELRATGVGDIAALYDSKGWLLIPSQDFSLKIDFSHNLITYGYTDLMVVLSNSNEIERNHLQFAASSYENNKNFYFELVENDTLNDEAWFDRTLDTGSLYVSYNYNFDELYLSNTGYGSINALETFTGLITDKWFGEPIKIAIGGSSDGEFIDSNDLFLDNFIIEQGVISISQDALELLNDLIQQVTAIDLNSGNKNSLLVKLDSALKILQDGDEDNDALAIHSLQAFINAVEAQRGKKISQEDADDLIVDAQQIIDMLSSE